MVGFLFYLVLAGLGLRFVYALARPLFWVVLALVLFIGLPLVLVLVFCGSFVG